MVKLILIALLMVSGSLIVSAKSDRMNVIYIMVDDLRPQLNCYGETQIKSPNIDRFANQATTFRNAYCNYPVCGPSRASIFSGLRPTLQRFKSNKASVESDANEALTMPEYFKTNGYNTAGVGKVYHHKNDKSEGWSIKPWNPQDDEIKDQHPDGWRDYHLESSLAQSRVNKNGTGPAIEISDDDPLSYFDGKTATKAIELIEQFKDDNKPFFITVGFVKPHLPFAVPRSFFEQYPLESIQIPENYFLPEQAPKEANHKWGELRAYSDIPQDGVLTDKKKRELIQGYYASVSYVDSMVGLVLDYLKENDLDKNSVVVLSGDHGWSLGEHSLWCKHSNFNKALNTTLIVRSPSTKGGEVSESLVELVDIYPSLVDITGGKLPSHLEGTSFAPILEDKTYETKNCVYSNMQNGCSVITKNHIYTEWFSKDGSSISNMLYDHRSDPEENHNIVNEPSSAEVVVKLRKELLKVYSPM